MADPGSLPTSWFERLYARDADPWRFATSPYERDKYAATLDALPKPRCRDALEVGCSIGVLTRQLAPRCERLLAIDVAEAALAQARERCAGLPHVRLACLRVPNSWPAGRYDLILLSEVLYYLGPADIRSIAEHAWHSLAADGTILMVHWRGPTDYPCSGDDAAESFCDAMAARCEITLRTRTRSYRLDRLQVRDRAAAAGSAACRLP